MRKGFDGLAGLVQTVLGEDPLSGHLFVFRGRRGHLAKVLWWSGDGYCLFSKRLDRGHFVWLAAAGGPRREFFGAHRSPIAGSSRWPASTPAAAGSLAARGDRTRARLQLPGL
jgi:transposase